ncbi:tRNA (adenine(22)-N(1))-methyltransferase [Acholeplasma granularum]|uniref:tRNA (adenine(22)-N(1))-methyltransferase n=1 Tax=Acholeplasma granularum TaxID=264635 RepID=UPI0004723761|nr:class I SAM-dependent methyltransferase [Acholeplasma granularum]
MNRIDFITSLLKGYDTVLDIGADHGLVIKKAIDLGYIKNGIAADINKGPLNHAKKNLTGYPVRFYLSDGFKKIDADYDLAVITGMGSRLIIDILKHAKLDRTYILGANEKVEILRSWLVSNNYEIIDEYIIYDGFYYVFLKVKKGQMNLSDSDLYVGPILKNKVEATQYFKHKKDHFLSLLNKVHGKKYDEFHTIYTYFNEVLKK